MSSQKTLSSLPPFTALPLRESDPIYSAWGLWGDDDELGTLNLLTDDVVVQAAREEIRTGKRLSLNWAINASRSEEEHPPMFHRQAFHHHIYLKPPRAVHDDVWTFNSQCSSQWDGLRHFGYQKERLFYNGVSEDEISGKDAGDRLGIQNMAKTGIVGRGVLLDFHRWRVQTGQVPDYDPFETGSFTLEHLKAVADHQGVSFRQGDILVVRSGFFAKYHTLTGQQRQTYASRPGPPQHSGLEQSEEMLAWLWETRFAAVAGDAPTFECFPTKKAYHLHEVLLGGWGMPIGEIFDLEGLSKHCQDTGRYTFFVASEPCNVLGAVASPPNIIAIF